ncbi:MAG: leucine-rich repeat domain-containing protein [Muribaculaceae bacterium]|nr:leucine-rich repeat domain-containing protein [Muribaculaceae bacterium]
MKKFIDRITSDTASLSDFAADKGNVSELHAYLFAHRGQIYVTPEGLLWEINRDSCWQNRSYRDDGEADGAVSILGKLDAKSIPDEIRIPEFISVGKVRLYTFLVGCDSAQIPKEFHLSNLKVKEIRIPDNVRVLRNMTSYARIRHFKFPRRMSFVSGSILNDSPMLQTIEFGVSYPEGAAAQLAVKGCDSLHSVIFPDFCTLINMFSQYYIEKNVSGYSSGGCTLHSILDSVLKGRLQVGISNQENISAIVMDNDVQEFRVYLDALRCTALFDKIESLVFGSEFNIYTEDAYGNGFDVVFQEVGRFGNLKKLYCPQGRISIDDTCSGLRQLEDVRLPCSLETIEDMAFMNCTSLKHIAIPSSLSYIGQYAFYGTGVERVEIPKNCIVADNAFEEGVEVCRM